MYQASPLQKRGCDQMARCVAVLLALFASTIRRAGADASGSCSVDDQCLAQLNLRTSMDNSSFCASFPSLASQVLSCAGITAEPLRPLRLLAPEQVQDYLPPVIQDFTAATGFQILVDYVPLDKAAFYILDTSAQGKQVYDGWLVDPVATVDLSQQGMMEALDSYIGSDPQADWIGICRYFRLSSAVYNGTVVGIPLAGKVSTLFYRRDVFAAAGILGPPSTWDELIMLAKVLNGSDFNQDGRGDYALCFQIFNGCLEDYTLFGQILAPYTQSKGLQSGWLFDPDTQQPFVDSEAAAKALAILQQLLPYTVPSTACELFQMNFLSGKCAMTIKWDEQYKALELFDKMAGLPYNPWKGGTVGYAQLPGSSEVLDRNTGKLIPCSDTTVCPYATKVTSLITGQPVLVNRAPYSGISGINGVINTAAPKSYRRTMYQFFSTLGSMKVGYPLVVGLTPTGPYRDRHLATDNASLAIWAAAGYDTNDVKAFLTNMQTSLDNPNIAMDARISRAYEYRDIMKQAVADIINGKPEADTQQALTSGFQLILSTTDPKLVWDGYWAALNLKRTYSYPLPPAPPQQIGSHRDSALTAGAIAAIAVAGTVGCLLCAITALLAYKQRHGQGWLWFRAPAPPKCGPSSTILVTDIENSTLLWESVPQDAMDQALTLHHTLVRSLLAKHHGYESCTEGDSFVVAFHSPGSAVRFAEDLQLSLLQQNWPQELLDSPYAAAVWATKVSVKGAPKRMTSSFLRTPALGSLTSGPASITREPDSDPTSKTGNSETPPGSVIAANTLSQPVTPVKPTDVSLLQDTPSGQTWVPPGSQPSPLGFPISTPHHHHHHHHHQARLAAVQATENLFAAGNLSSAFRPGSLLDVLRGISEKGSNTLKTGTMPALQFLCSQWQVCPPASHADPLPAQAVLTFRGLRVRVGLHSGISEPQDAQMNKTNNRVAYGGQPLLMAKSAADCAAGGQVLVTQAALEQLPHEDLATLGLVMNLGDYGFNKDGTLLVITLLQVIPRSLDSRLLFFSPLPRNTSLVQAGVLDAPVGQVTICFVNMVGAASLQTQAREVAVEAMEVFSALILDLLLLHPIKDTDYPVRSTSYLVELSGGFCLAAFTSPAAALAWATALVHRLLVHPWSEEVLSNELCEPVVVGGDLQRMHKGNSKSRLLFCGPRLKIGIDTGQVHATINPVTGRMAYRGRVMNRTARIAEKAGAGQVWCSENTWDSAKRQHAVEVVQNGLEASALGPFDLKGVSTPLNLMHVTAVGLKATSAGQLSPSLSDCASNPIPDAHPSSYPTSEVYPTTMDSQSVFQNPLAVIAECPPSESSLGTQATQAFNEDLTFSARVSPDTGRSPSPVPSAATARKQSSVMFNVPDETGERAPVTFGMRGQSASGAAGSATANTVSILGSRISVHCVGVDVFNDRSWQDRPWPASGNLSMHSHSMDSRAETAWPSRRPSTRTEALSRASSAARSHVAIDGRVSSGLSRPGSTIASSFSSTLHMRSFLQGKNPGISPFAALYMRSGNGSFSAQGGSSSHSSTNPSGATTSSMALAEAPARSSNSHSSLSSLFRTAEDAPTPAGRRVNQRRSMLHTQGASHSDSSSAAPAMLPTGSDGEDGDNELATFNGMQLSK